MRKEKECLGLRRRNIEMLVLGFVVRGTESSEQFSSSREQSAEERHTNWRVARGKRANGLAWACWGGHGAPAATTTTWPTRPTTPTLPRYYYYNDYCASYTLHSATRRALLFATCCRAAPQSARSLLSPHVQGVLPDARPPWRAP
jgi:hypothetical protein